VCQDFGAMYHQLCFIVKPIQLKLGGGYGYGDELNVSACSLLSLNDSIEDGHCGNLHICLFKRERAFRTLGKRT